MIGWFQFDGVGKRRQHRHEAKGAPRLPAGLVGFASRVLYLPVTKAASTSMKTMLGEAEERFALPELPFMPMSTAYFADFVHSPEVHGLRPYRELPLKSKRMVLASPDWWRVTVVRDPYDRIVSSWQNRVVMLGAVLPAEIRSHLGFVFDGQGRIDVVASFDAFVRQLAAHRQTFFIDDHFRPQSRMIRPEMVSYTHLLRLEDPSSLDRFREDLSLRVGKTLQEASYNEGLGIRTSDVMTAPLAALVEDVYAEDFELFGYRSRTFPDQVVREPFSAEATKLALFLHDIAADREARRGARYALKELRSRVGG